MINIDESKDNVARLDAILLDEDLITCCFGFVIVEIPASLFLFYLLTKIVRRYKNEQNKEIKFYNEMNDC